MLVVEICKYISATVFSRESEISEIGGYTRTALSQEASCTQISNICATQIPNRKKCCWSCHQLTTLQR